MLVNMLGRAFVTTKVHSQTDIAAKGPEMDRSEVGKISEEIIHGSPLAPKLHIPPKIIMKAVPETVEADFGAVRLGLLTAM
jgi:hypothetical protein